MKRNLILTILLILPLFFLMGCFGQSPQSNATVYKYDAITIENYYVTNYAPISGGITRIEFDVKNNIDKSLPVEVYFFDIPGFTIQKLNCEIGETTDKKSEDNTKCIFGDLDSMDSRTVSLDLKASNVDVDTEYTISFSVKYNISGSRDAQIPIIDGTSVKKPSFKFSQSQPTYGPIILDIQPQLEREVVVGDEIVKEYWGTVDTPFDTKFVFTHVGTEPSVKRLEIPAGNVKFELVGLEIYGFCDDFSNGVSTRDVIIPYDILYCNFKPTEDMPEYTAMIYIDFTYTYEYLRSQTLVIQPIIKQE